MVRERRFDAGPVRLHYAEGPTGGVPLVLLHGATWRWQSFLPVLPILAWRYHTFALDLRGHGRSGHARPGEVYEVEEYGEDVSRFLRARVGKPAVLAGHALGAEVALWVAAASPARVRALVLEEPGLYALTDGRFPQHPIHRWLQAVHHLRLSWPAQDELAGALQALLPKTDAMGRRAWAAALQQMDPAALAQFLDGSTMQRIDHDELLAQVNAPVLLLQGNPALEGMLSEQDAQRAQTRLRDCTHVYRADLGHDWHSLAPLAFCQLVNSFIETLHGVAVEV